MVTIAQHLDLTFGALSDATRRAILVHLAHGPATVGSLAEPFAISRPAISKHLRVLEKAGLVETQKDGRVSRCILNAGPMKDAAEWVEWYRKFWENQLDSLATYFEQNPTVPGPTPAGPITARPTLAGPPAGPSLGGPTANEPTEKESTQIERET